MERHWESGPTRFVLCSGARFPPASFLPAFRIAHHQTAGRMFPRTALYAFLLSLPFGSFTQADTLRPGPADSAILLPAAVVVEKPLRAGLAGSREESWDAQGLENHGGNHLAALLEQESGVFIKSYGLGSLATTSIRGGSAGQASVLWNGLPLQSPMLGQLDFSLLPLSFADQVEVQYGGNTAAWGSGAIGGVVSLGNQADFEKKAALSLQSTLGSFGLCDQQAKARYGKGRWRAATRLFHRQAANDFPYRIRPDLPEKRQSNAALRQSGLLQEFYWRPAPGQQLAIHAWLQQSEREIPPTTVQNVSQAWQEDRFVRTALHWKAVGRNMAWQARAGLFRENLDYRDEQAGLRSFTRFWTAVGEAEGEWFINERQRLQFGIGHTWMQAQADAYERPPQQNRTAPFAGFRQQIGGWQLQGSLRQEAVDGRLAPPAPGLGAEGLLANWLTASAKLTRNYRLPTFNDLYWQPGGDPGLQPESGWSQEGGIKIHGAPGRHKLSYALTGFSRRIDNWILWSLREGQAFWSASNITRVWSRGLEQRLRWELAGREWKLHLSGGYDYILSTSEVEVENPRMEAGQQLLYVPRHRAFGKLSFRWKGLLAEYRHQHTGAVGGQNVDTLPGYQVGFISLAYSHAVSSWEGRLFFHANNLWNEQYRVIERRPMPGRHFQAGLELKFSK